MQKKLQRMEARWRRPVHITSCQLSLAELNAQARHDVSNTAIVFIAIRKPTSDPHVNSVPVPPRIVIVKAARIFAREIN